jgi:hypothetical protein
MDQIADDHACVLEWVAALWGRIVQGREGRAPDQFDLYPGPTVPFWYSGVSHANGHSHWEWSGAVTIAPHRRLHFRGLLTVLDADGVEAEVYPYERSCF